MKGIQERAIVKDANSFTLVKGKKVCKSNGEI